LLYFINKILHLSKKRQSENSALALIRSSDHEASKMANWYHVLLNLFWTDTGGKQGVALVVGGLRATFCRLRETAGDLWERVNQDSRNTSRPQNKAGMGIRMVEWYVYYSPIGDGSLYTALQRMWSPAYPCTMHGAELNTHGIGGRLNLSIVKRSVTVGLLEFRGLS